MHPLVDSIAKNQAALDRVLGERLNAKMTPDDRDVADHAVNGEIAFRWNGTHFTPVGRRAIDWKGSHHRHQEWPAQLNRFFFLAPLAVCYRETRDERYPEAAADFLRDWLQAHPVGQGWEKAPYDNVLNLCIRMGGTKHIGWLSILPIFAASPAFDDVLIEALLASAFAQLTYLTVNIAQDINWRIANADSLVTAGLLLAPDPRADRFRSFGIQVLRDAFRRQVLPDGAHYERNPSYHHWMASVVRTYWELDTALKLGLDIRVDTVARMHDYSLACTAPDGGWNALHDCQSNRTDFYRPQVRRDWETFRQKAGLPLELPPLSQYFPDAGQVYLRDGWGPEATYLIFDATRWGGGHCHLSRNSVNLYVQGRPVLVDPGTLTYEGSDPLAAHGKSTRAHNTLNLNGWNQSETDPSRTRFFSGPGYDVASSDYEGGYWPGRYLWNFKDGHGRGLWASHNRSLLWAQGRFIFIVDNFTRSPDANPETEKPFAEFNWQFEAGPVEIDAAGRRAWTGYPDRNLLMLFPFGSEGWTMSLAAGSRDPLRGWLPGQNGYIAAPQLTLTRNPMDETWFNFVTVLVPFTGGTPPALQTRITEYAPTRRFWTLNLDWADGTRDEVAWTHRLNYMIGSTPDFVTDGSILHRHWRADGVLTGGAVANGTFIEPGKGPRLEEAGLIVF